MARVFEHKSGFYSGQEDEFGWSHTSEVTEVSPASLWALEDDIPLPVNPNSSALAEQSATEHPELFQSELVEAPKSADRSALAEHGATEDLELFRPELVDAQPPADSTVNLDHDEEFEWWSRPDITEEPQDSSEILDESGSGFVLQEPLALGPEIVDNAAEVDQDEFLPGCEKRDEGPQSEQAENSSVYTLPEAEVVLDDPDITVDSPIPPEVLIATSSSTVENTIASRPGVLQAAAPVLEHAVLSNHPAASRPRVLDESAVLPHEASFATVSLYREHNSVQSPVREVVGKFISGVTRLGPALLIIVIGCAAVFYGFKFKSVWINSDSNEVTSVATAPKPLPPTTASRQLHSTLKTEPGLVQEKVSEISKPASETTVSAPSESVGQPERSKTQTPKSIEDDHSDKSVRSTRASGAATRHTVNPKPRAGASAVKRSAENRAAVTPRSEGATKVPEAETSAVPSGGGERPRRVSQQTDPHAPSAKPKVIDWP